MTKLVEAGLNANDCFERMVTSGWQGIEVKYFQQDLTPTKAEISQQIRDRELKAQAEKRLEAEQARNLKNIVAESNRRSPGRPEGLKNLLKTIGLSPNLQPA